MADAVTSDAAASAEAIELERVQTRRLEELHRRLHEIDLFKDGPIHGLIYCCIVASGFSIMLVLWLFPFGLSSQFLTRWQQKKFLTKTHIYFPVISLVNVLIMALTLQMTSGLQFSETLLSLMNVILVL